MIIKNGKTISSIYKGSQVIDKIMKGTLIVYESWKNLTASGIPPLTLLNCKGVDLVDYKIYGNSEQSILPSEYQQIEYIESSRTQYIDIKYTYKINDEINISFMKTQDAESIQGVFGNGNKSSYIGTVLYVNNLNVLTITIGGVLGGEFYKYNTPIQNNVKYDVKFQGPNVYLNNELIITVSNILKNGTQEDFSLFRRWGTNGFYGRIYSFNVVRNNEMIFDFIPCYRKSDNVIGMYDLVENKFYTNLGTGEFTKGANAPTPEAPIEVESVGDYDETTGKYKIPVKANEIITNIYLNEPLRKIGDYADYVDFGNSKVVRKIVEKIYDGTENIYAFNTNNSSYCPYPYTYNVIEGLGVVVDDICLCTHLEHQATFSYTVDGNNRFRVLNSTSNAQSRFVFRFYLDGAIVEDTDKVKKLLTTYYNNGNPLTIYYALATPTEETIELPNIPTFKGTTILSVDTTIQPSNLEVVYKGK